AECESAGNDGQADMIVGIYYNDDRAQYLDYVQPAFVFDPVVVFVARDKKFPYKDQLDLVGKKVATNQGESFGNEFDSFMKDKLRVERTDCLDAAIADLVASKAEYAIEGSYRVSTE